MSVRLLLLHNVVGACNTAVRAKTGATVNMVLFYSVDPIWHTLSISGLLFLCVVSFLLWTFLYTKLVSSPIMEFPDLFFVIVVIDFDRLQPQNEHIELHQKRYGRRLDHAERTRKRAAREVHRRSEIAQKLTGAGKLLLCCLSIVL
jgi:hypothetical protein